MLYVPVVDNQQRPLMPTHPNRAQRWIEISKATPFWKKGVFCVRLNVEPSDRKTQPIAVGVDPGSKKEGFTVKSSAHTFLNIQADAKTDVKDKVEKRRNARRSRRQRKTPCRANRMNRSRGCLPPSTKARWQWKLRVLNWLKKLFPISHVIVEDIKAKTTGKRCWDRSFSPIQVGKKWFYDQIENLSTKNGFDTKNLRDDLGLNKSKNKLSDKFEAHCVDSWVLANSVVGGHTKPDNTRMFYIIPLQLHRRQLQVFQPAKGGIRKPYGGTRSLGLKRGSLVKHSKWGLAYVGGTSKDRLSLHELSTGKRLTQSAKREDVKFLTYSSWRWHSSTV